MVFVKEEREEEMSEPEPWGIKQEEPEPCRIKHEEPEPWIIKQEEPEPCRIKHEEPEPWIIKQEEPEPWIIKHEGHGGCCWNQCSQRLLVCQYQCCEEGCYGRPSRDREECGRGRKNPTDRQ
ncbi:hypothetical protein G5714_002907 [Onychostoma macrolepis]|uniref:Uncharacterized protein n=1 Tax=Onychostoma macrolepis TaxID=369639 RepID=A0A7J6D7Y8_9TELE|nr:hypothetical protein G5714_002907 [Onychostoma macrolepis]